MSGADDQNRTGDLILTKDTLYRLSYISIWLRGLDLNQRPSGYEPDELQLLHPAILVEGEGFEPSKPEAADLQSAPFNHSGIPPRIVITNKLELAKGIEPSTY